MLETCVRCVLAIASDPQGRIPSASLNHAMPTHPPRIHCGQARTQGKNAITQSAANEQRARLEFDLGGGTSYNTADAAFYLLQFVLTAHRSPFNGNADHISHVSPVRRATVATPYRLHETLGPLGPKLGQALQVCLGFAPPSLSPSLPPTRDPPRGRHCAVPLALPNHGPLWDDFAGLSDWHRGPTSLSVPQKRDNTLRPTGGSFSCQRVQESQTQAPTAARRRKVDSPAVLPLETFSRHVGSSTNA